MHPIAVELSRLHARHEDVPVVVGPVGRRIERDVRVRRRASSRSKNRSSTPVAVRENRLKLTPPSMTVAPSGELLPIVWAEAPDGIIA